MDLGDKVLLGLNTTVISMGIVFMVLIALSVIITFQYRILKALGVISDNIEKPEVVATQVDNTQPMKITDASKNGLSKGEAKLVGVEDEELVAVVMAAVSHASSIPLSDLRIKSIKRVDNNWSNTAKQEMTNQRL